MWPACWKVQHQLGSILFTVGWRSCCFSPLHYETQRASEEVCPVLSSKQSSTFVLLCCFCFGLEIGEGYFKGHKRWINSGGFFFFYVCVLRWEFMSTDDAGCPPRCLVCCATVFLQHPIKNETKTQDGTVGVLCCSVPTQGRVGWRDIQSFAIRPPNHRYIWSISLDLEKQRFSMQYCAVLF